jgi:hypothetical protein
MGAIMSQGKGDETGRALGDAHTSDDLSKALDRVQRRLRRLTSAVVFLAFTVLLCAAAVHGYLANYFGSDVLMFSATSAGAALLGFGFGWVARRRP